MGLIMYCCSSLQKKKAKGEKRGINRCGDEPKSSKVLHVDLEHHNRSNIGVQVPLGFAGQSWCKVKVKNPDTSPVAADPKKVDYEEEDDHEQTHATDVEVNNSNSLNPGSGKAEFWASPELKRSCSNFAGTSRYLDEVLISKSYKEKKRLAEDAMSHISVPSRCSADNVILKKHSSSQILPSGSQKLWWKLLLWSHRNLAKQHPVVARPSIRDQQGGYSSDSMEPRQAAEPSKLRSRSLLARESTEPDTDNHSWDGFYGGSGAWPHNQWVAFPMNSSPFERVSEWIAETSRHQPYEGSDDDCNEGGNFPCPENGALQQHLTRKPDEISHANTVIQSLNANSAAAHITGLGLKVVPFMSHLISLRAVNLSGNLIAHIGPGCLPKGLHILNLSKNKISAIEGLRELTRLRVLDLSYNRISSVGQGLSNCTLIKELYLAGNKISNVEGLHRLLKLTVLDLSFNKVTTAKALGQLVSNYNSLTSVHLLGNPIHSNTGDDHLKKIVSSLLPKLALLNRQPVNPQKAREIRAVATSKSGLGNGRSTRRKAVRRGCSSSSPLPTGKSGHARSTQKIKGR